MLPAVNERTTFTYAHPNRAAVARGEAGDLPCERVRPGMIRSFWLPSEEELAVLVAGGVVEMVVFAEPIPPVSLNALTRVQANEEYE